MKFAVILSGCGNLDGSEIHESVSTLLAIDRANAECQCFAPNKEQHHVMDFVKKTETQENRNVLQESARIARGNVKDLKEFDIKDYDALMLPGGFGAAKNLSNFAFKGVEFDVIPEVKNAIISTVEAGKPIGALCIAPVIVSKVLSGAKVTIGQDKSAADVIEKIGAKHINTNSGEIIVDEKYKLVTAPCYMLDVTIKDIANEAQKVVNEIIQLMN